MNSIKTEFLGAFAKLRKAAIRFVMSVFTRGTDRLPLDGFSWNFVFDYFSKIGREHPSFNKIGQDQRVLYKKTNTYFFYHLAHFFFTAKCFKQQLWRKSKHTFCVHFFFFRKSCRLWDNVEKFCRVRQATDDWYGACAYHAGYLRLQTHTQNM